MEGIQQMIKETDWTINKENSPRWDLFTISPSLMSRSLVLPSVRERGITKMDMTL
jgi:hypothetical protein